MSVDRPALEARWLQLTRVDLPMVAGKRGWPVTADHCFQRILLDNACGGRWYDHIAGRPAYRHTEASVLIEAVSLGESALGDRIGLDALNARSLAWRRA